MITKNCLILLMTALMSHNLVFGEFVKYNQLTEMCCSGTVVERHNDTQLGCCGTAAFNSSTSVCCNGTAHPLPEDKAEGRWACCPQMKVNPSEVTVYNTRTHQCCGGAVLEKPEAGAWYECCNGQLYSTATHRCCGNAVVQLPPGTECCAATVTYDTSAQTCCRLRGVAMEEGMVIPFKLHDKDGGQKCCGLEVYDPETQFCCNGAILPLPEGISGNETTHGRCCGKELINDRKNELCHNGKVWKRNSTNYLVCGDQFFDFTQQFCCGNQTFERSSGLRCCWGAGLSFDPMTQVCCGKSVEMLTEEDKANGITACCSKRMRDFKMFHKFHRNMEITQN